MVAHSTCVPASCGKQGAPSTTHPHQCALAGAWWAGWCPSEQQVSPARCHSRVWCALAGMAGPLTAASRCCCGISVCQVYRAASLLSGSSSVLHISSKTGTLMGSESMGASACSIMEMNVKFMDRKRKKIWTCSSDVLLIILSSAVQNLALIWGAADTEEPSNLNDCCSVPPVWTTCCCSSLNLYSLPFKCWQSADAWSVRSWS